MFLGVQHKNYRHIKNLQIYVEKNKWVVRTSQEINYFLSNIIKIADLFYAYYMLLLSRILYIIISFKPF